MTNLSLQKVIKISDNYDDNDDFDDFFEKIKKLKTEVLPNLETVYVQNNHARQDENID